MCERSSGAAQAEAPDFTVPLVFSQVFPSHFPPLLAVMALMEFRPDLREQKMKRQRRKVSSKGQLGAAGRRIRIYRDTEGINGANQTKYGSINVCRKLDFSP